MVPLNPDADKYTRALTVAAYYEHGSVWHPRDAPWLDEWEEELVAFPAGAHDDQVDTAAYAGIMFFEMPTRVKISSRTTSSSRLFFLGPRPTLQA